MKNNYKEKPKNFTSPHTKRANRIPPGQVETEGFPVLHYGQVPTIDIERWRFRIFGLVENEVVLNYKELLSLPLARVISDVHCVTGWSKLDNLWEGVRTKEILKLVKLKDNARFVLVHAEGGFTTNLSLDDFLGEDALFAYKHNNKLLTPEHGYPLRLVVPHLYFWKSAKWVNGLEFVDKNIPGFWEFHGYHMRGDPWNEERYSSLLTMLSKK